MELDRSHDPERRSWVASARILGTDRPLQNLPLCAFRAAGTDTPTSIGVGIGDEVLDVGAAVHEGLLRLETATAAACRQPTLDEVMALDAGARRELRLAVSDLLAEGVSPAIRERAPARLFPIRECVLSLPCTIGDYTDFYASIFHATNLGRQLRPESPLLPNYRWMPIAYHGRASSIVASGTPVVRPRGQTRPEADSPPVFGPTRRLDYEVELGFYVGPGNPRGEPIPMGRAAEHLVGACLLNDWSARDIQAWEYQPLGPFLGKSFATTVSPWVVTMEALAPFRVPARAGRPDDPPPLPHLDDPSDRAQGGLDIVLEVAISTRRMREARLPAHPLARVRTADLYWTPAQMVAHHTSNGCNLRAGDLLGSGTVSNAPALAVGSLTELTEGGGRPVELPGRESRKFLEDGDEVVIRGWCEREGSVPIGFGECRGLVAAAPA